MLLFQAKQDFEISKSNKVKVICATNDFNEEKGYYIFATGKLKRFYTKEVCFE